MGAPVITTEACYSSYPKHNYVIAIGDNAVRERVAKELRSALPNVLLPSLAHQSSVIGVGSVVGIGTIVMPNANIGPSSVIGDFCIINTSSSIDHDCSIKDFASIAPGVVTGGNVRVGLRSAISISAAVKHGVNIGDDTVIGANSYVNNDVDSEVVAYGTPCKFVRNRKVGDSYLN